jgi:two-component system nitrate/nitrite response regulator NarP
MSAANKIRLLIADDHKLVRDMIEMLMANRDGYCFETADSLPDVLDKIATSGSFDIILLDLIMPGMGGMIGVKRVIEANRAGAVVLFSGQVPPGFVRNALASGLRGYIPKSLPPTAFLEALHKISGGEIYLPDSHPAPPSRETGLALSLLSPQEYRVLTLLCEGMSNKAIARLLDLTEANIKTQMRSLCAKIGARNRTEAALIARDIAESSLPQAN